jgi:hypothetical protein
LGTNDGISQSNTLYSEKYLGWHGALVEPNVDNYNKCLENWSLFNKVFCFACMSFDYEDESVFKDNQKFFTFKA